MSSAKASKYILVLFYQGVLSILSSPISIFKTNKKQKQTNIEGVSLNNWIVYFFIGLILFVFTFLYLKSNPVLGQLFKNIDFSFINIGFVFFTLFQFLMLFGLYKIDTSKNIDQLNLKSIFLSSQTFKNEDFEEFKVVLRDWWASGKYKNDEVKNWNDYSDIPATQARILMKVINS